MYWIHVVAKQAVNVKQALLAVAENQNVLAISPFSRTVGEKLLVLFEFLFEQN